MQKQLEADQAPELAEFRFNGPNPNYWQSVYLGLKGGIFYAPGTLLHAMKLPFFALLGATGYFIGAILIWLITRIGFVVLGLLGRVSRNVSKE